MTKAAPTRYIPANSRAIGIPGVGVVYKYELANGKHCAIGYAGERSKSTFHLSFRSEEARTGHISAFLRNLDEAKARKAERRAARVTYKHDLQIGDLLHYSWGYDQTNCEYYQVVARTDHTVKIRAIAATFVKGSEGFMSERLRPTPGAFLDNAETLVKRVSPGWNGSEPIISMDHGIATRCAAEDTHYASHYA